jgi:hypothetical protein
MTQDIREALKLALEALKRYGNRHRATYLLDGAWDEEITLGDKAITAIKEALAQTQEPFAYVNVEKRRLEFASPYVKWYTPTTIKLDKIPLYTTPPQRTWQGLTEEDKKQMFKEANYHWEMTAGEYAERIGQLTEAKLKEKNSA